MAARCARSGLRAHRVLLALVTATALSLLGLLVFVVVPPRRLSLQPALRPSRHKTESASRPVQVGSLPIYVQSAIVDVRRPERGRHQVVLQTWSAASLWPADFRCCFHTTDGGTVDARASSWKRFNAGELQSTQFRCNVTDEVRPSTVTFAERSCSGKQSISLPVEFPEVRPGELAVCAKIAYSRLDPQRLFEWFELQQLLGVTRVVTFRFHDLEEASMRVLKFYRDRGVLTMLPYVLPGKLKKHPRGFRVAERFYPQTYADTHVCVMDCVLRLAGFSHVAVIDFDEIIVPHVSSAKLMYLPTFLQDMRNSSLFHMRFVLRTPAEFDRVKVVHRPAMTSIATTHRLVPAGDYTVRTVVPAMAAVHHYRSCRPYWSKQRCMASKRHYDDDLLVLEQPLAARLQTIRRLQPPGFVPGK